MQRPCYPAGFSGPLAYNLISRGFPRLFPRVFGPATDQATRGRMHPLEHRRLFLSRIMLDWQSESGVSHQQQGKKTAGENVE